ncbi:hypothetical protein [Methylobacterium sp. JK268]
MFALVLPALLVGIGGALEAARGVTFRQRLWSAVELACSQSATYVNAQKPQDVTAASTSTTYPAAIADIVDRNFTAKGITTAPAATVTTTDTTIHIEATRDQALVLGALLNRGSLSFTAARDCATMSTTAAKAAAASAPIVLTTESFEAGHNVASTSGGWTVTGGVNNGNAWNGWTTQGAGIEIDSQRAIAVSSVLFGSYFAELDSDCNTAANSGTTGCQSNSTMSRILSLTPGSYQIRYWYVSRLQDPAVGGQVICGAKDSDVSYYTTNGQTNRIEVYVEQAGNYTYNLNNIADVCVQSNHWVERVVNFTVAVPSDYRISWRAAGRQDTYGGLIDNLRICRNYCPAS